MLRNNSTNNTRYLALRPSAPPIMHPAEIRFPPEWLGQTVERIFWRAYAQLKNDGKSDRGAIIYYLPERDSPALKMLCFN